jgi:hypothetical protein
MQTSRHQSAEIRDQRPRREIADGGLLSCRMLSGPYDFIEVHTQPFSNFQQCTLVLPSRAAVRLRVKNTMSGRLARSPSEVRSRLSGFCPEGSEMSDRVKLRLGRTDYALCVQAAERSEKGWLPTALLSHFRALQLIQAVLAVI